jgi:Ca2+-dependent lipid-binding protein
VYVLGARDIPVADITGTSDPYVRVSLLRIGEQGGGHKKDDARRTRVRSKTLEPVWAQVRLFLFLFLFPYVWAIQLTPCFCLLEGFYV